MKYEATKKKDSLSVSIKFKKLVSKGFTFIKNIIIMNEHIVCNSNCSIVLSGVRIILALKIIRLIINSGVVSIAYLKSVFTLR